MTKREPPAKTADSAARASNRCAGGVLLLRRQQTGVTSIEYALIGALLSVAIVGAVSLTGANLRTMYEYVSEEVGKVACKVTGC